MPTRNWGTEKLVNKTTAGDQTNAVTTVLKNGNFVVVWQNGSGSTSTILGQIFNPVGDRVGGEVLIDQGSVGDALPSIAALADGGFIVSAEHSSTAGDRDIYSFVYNASGEYKTRITAATTSDESNPDVASIGDGRDSIVVWQDAGSNSGDINCVQYNNDGSIRSQFIVNANRDGQQIDPAVAVGPSGGLAAVVWSDFYKIKGILVNYDGTTGPEFQVNAPTADLPGSADVSYIAAGRFVVTWSSANQGGGGGIHARLYQVYSGYATPLGDEFFANSSSNGGDPTVTRLPNSGGFVVSWSESNIFFPTKGPDTSGSSIHLQAFDGAGAKIGGEIIVNTTMIDSQYRPSVTALLDDRVVVTWTDASMTGGDTSGRAIRMQIVDPRDGLVYGSGGSDVLYGNDFANDEMSGGSGADRLLGLRGDDNIFGGDDNDILIGGLGADTMTGGSGTDAASYASSLAGVIVDLETNANSGGEAAGDYLTEIENIIGSNYADTLRGDAGANRLDGGGGADILVGRRGNDTYDIDNPGDRVVEAASGGNDTVNTLISYALSAGQEIEILKAADAAGTGKMTLVGNEFGQTLAGNNGANILDGRLGGDVLTGGRGADTFVFSTTLGSSNVDHITDFATEDTIRLSKAVFAALAPGPLAEGALKNISTGKLDADDRILYKQATGELFYDADGSGKGSAVKFAVLDNHAALTAADFLVA